MIRSAKPNLLVAALACLLFPVWASGESHIASLTEHSTAEPSVATAHVLFKIVIPQVLSMDFAEPAPHRMLLSAAGHRSIARFETCVPARPAQSARGMSCTASMP